MVQRKRSETVKDTFVTNLGTARPYRLAMPRFAAPVLFEVPPEHLERIREARAQVRRGEIVEEDELDALLAPDPQP